MVMVSQWWRWEMPSPLPNPHHLWQVREPTLYFTTGSTQENRPCTFPGQHNRTDSMDRKGYRWSAWEHEQKRSGPALREPYVGMCEVGTKPLPLNTSRRKERWSWDHNRERENWPYLSAAAALRRVTLAPHLGSTVELALVVQVWVNRPEEQKSRRTHPTLASYWIGWASQGRASELTPHPGGEDGRESW